MQLHHWELEVIKFGIEIYKRECLLDIQWSVNDWNNPFESCEILLSLAKVCEIHRILVKLFPIFRHFYWIFQSWNQVYSSIDDWTLSYQL